MHITGWRALGRLAYGDEWDIFDSFQAFEFDVIEKVSCGPVDFIDQ